MTEKMIKSLLIGCLLGTVASAQAALIVTPSPDTTSATATSLVNAMLAGGGGITVSGATLTGAAVQSGTFSGGNSAFLGFDSGIVLSSGTVNDLLLAASGTASGADSDQGTAGDAKLDAILSGFTTNDASVLAFTFTPTGDFVQFSYVFGSTEYNQYVNSIFNDIFAFFVNDVNYALVPGSTTPVSINNVNCGENTGPTSAGSPGNPPITNCNFFVNNRNQDETVGANALVNLGGLTQVFGFTAPVNAGVENTMYLAIADTSDEILDSAVFIAGGTFSTCGGAGQPACGDNGNGTIPEPATLALLGIALAGLGFSRRRRSH